MAAQQRLRLQPQLLIAALLLMLLAHGPSVHALRGHGLPLSRLLQQVSRNMTTSSSNTTSSNSSTVAGGGSRTNTTASEPSTPAAAAGISKGAPPPAASPPPSNSITAAGMTLSGLQQELEAKAHSLEAMEGRHSRATVAAAATIGALLLAMLVACAGVLIYKRFRASQHTRGSRGGGAGKRYAYDADRLLGDSAGGL